MPEYCKSIHTVECGCCKKEFVPAPYNAFKKYGRHYCSYTCYRNAVRGTQKITIAFGIRTYMDFNEVANNLMDELTRKGVEIKKVFKRFLYFETNHIKVQFIPFSKNVEGYKGIQETFGIFRDEFTPKYLRRGNTNPPYEGDIVSYILHKESMY